jgi:ribosome recycling factor
VKIAKAEGEDTKISIRNARRDAIEVIKKLQKDGLPEDVAKDAEAKMDSVTKDYVAKIDDHVAKKEKEILTI